VESISECHELLKTLLRGESNPKGIERDSRLKVVFSTSILKPKKGKNLLFISQSVLKAMLKVFCHRKLSAIQTVCYIDEKYHTPTELLYIQRIPMLSLTCGRARSDHQ
jgi:tRNA A37 threonylcarbamoyladenosine dehydratase